MVCKTVKTLGDIPELRKFTAAQKKEDNIYIFGGFSGSYLKNMFEYNISKKLAMRLSNSKDENKWRRVILNTDTLCERSEHTFTLYQDYFIVWGGSQKNDKTSICKVSMIGLISILEVIDNF